MLARACRTKCKQVIALVQNTDTEADSLNGARLPDDIRQVLQILCCCEIELFRITALVQAFRCKLLYGHRIILIESRCVASTRKVRYVTG